MAEIPEWAAKKAAELMNAADTSYVSIWSADDVGCYPSISAFARYIAEHETAPVDPDVLAVREILAAWEGTPLDVDDIMDGARDKAPGFTAVLAAYRELASKRNA